MRIIKLTCELNKHQIMTSVDEIFTSKGSRYAALLFLEAAKLARPVPEPAKPVCLQDFSRIGLNCSLLILKPIQVIGGLPLLHIYVIQVLKLIRRFGEVLSSLFCIMMNYIGELPKICYLNAWMMIRPEWLWERSKKVFVVRINRLPR